MGREESGDGARGWLSLGTKLALLLLIGMIHSTNGQKPGSGKRCNDDFKFMGTDPVAVSEEMKNEIDIYFEMKPVAPNPLSEWPDFFPILNNPKTPREKGDPRPVLGESYEAIIAHEKTSKGTCADDAEHCGYDMKNKYYDYICTTASSETELKKKNETEYDKRGLDNGFFCNKGGNRFGYKYDEKDSKSAAQAEHLTRTKAFEQLEKLKIKENLEKANNHHCKEKNCKYSHDKHAFICGGQGRSSPLSMLAIAGLVVGILSLSA